MGTNFPQENEESIVYKSDEVKTYHNSSLNIQVENETAVAVQNSEVWSVNISNAQELDAKVKSMMTKSENSIAKGTKNFKKAYICTVCGKEGIWPNIRNHIEQTIRKESPFRATSVRSYSGQEMHKDTTIESTICTFTESIYKIRVQKMCVLGVLQCVYFVWILTIVQMFLNQKVAFDHLVCLDK